jgi:putative component of toxin-antitoxin plasmid stabilization module
MNIFAIEKIELITGKISFYKLFKNNDCEFDTFISEIKEEGNLEKELITIQSRMQEVSEGKLMPKNKFRDITPKKETVKEYEIKTHHLRVYLFHEEKTGRIVVCGGKKTTQQKDIKHFRSIKKEYFQSK